MQDPASCQVTPLNEAHASPAGAEQTQFGTDDAFLGIQADGTYKAVGGGRSTKPSVMYLDAKNNSAKLAGFGHVYFSTSFSGADGKVRYLSPGVLLVTGSAKLVYLGTGTRRGKPTTLIVCNDDFSDVSEIPPSAVMSLKPPNREPDMTAMWTAMTEYGSQLVERSKALLEEKGLTSDAKTEKTPACQQKVLSSSDGSCATGLDDSKDPAFLAQWTPHDEKRVVRPPHRDTPSTTPTAKSHSSGKKRPARKLKKQTKSGGESEESPKRSAKSHKQEEGERNITLPSRSTTSMEGAAQQTTSAITKEMQDIAQALAHTLGGVHHVMGNIELHFHFDNGKQ